MERPSRVEGLGVQVSMIFGHQDSRGVGFRGVTGSAKVVYTKQDCVEAVSRPHDDLKLYWSSPSTQHFNPTDLFEKIFQVDFWALRDLDTCFSLCLSSKTLSPNPHG